MKQRSLIVHPRLDHVVTEFSDARYFWCFAMDRSRIERKVSGMAEMAQNVEQSGIVPDNLPLSPVLLSLAGWPSDVTKGVTGAKGPFSRTSSIPIRVNSVNPTVVMTAMGRKNWEDPQKAGPVLARIPLGKFVDVENVTSAVLFMLSDQAAMITGTTLPVDGGLTCN
ncbi:hypothetical protein ACOMHN_009963 [Nucella lapillus]